jgi:hypothetical protein
MSKLIDVFKKKFFTALYLFNFHSKINCYIIETKKEIYLNLYFYKYSVCLKVIFKKGKKKKFYFKRFFYNFLILYF